MPSLATPCNTFALKPTTQKITREKSKYLNKS
jgi:hypothetical protein